MRPLLLALIACHPAGRAPTPAPIACRPERIGPVRVSGAERALVPSLTVLEGTADDQARVDRIATAALEPLHARGYAKATLRVTREGCGLAVDVELGARYRVAAIDFETSDAFPAKARLAALEASLGTVNTLGGLYVPERLDDALDALEQRYRDAGWVDATIDDPIASFDGTKVSLRIPVHAGHRFHVGVVRAVGGGPVSRATVLEALGVSGGEWYDGSSIRTGVERARHQLAHRLELHTSIDPGRRVVDVEVEVRR